MLIKICGLKRTKDIDYVNEAHPDFAGFVFAPSRRQVSDEVAKVLKERLDPSIKSVGVFVDEDISRIVRLVNEHIIDLVQLHGHEEDDYIAALKTSISCPIIKAIRMPQQDIRSYDVDYYLFDGVTPGSGEAFDWTLLKKVDRPYFLAGGITIDNLKAALTTDAFALDCSSGVETDGFKDLDKINAIVKGVRNE